jgi:hypothetical protein
MYTLSDRDTSELTHTLIGHYAREGEAAIEPYAQHATAACCRKCIEYWHETGPVLEIERAMEMKEAS